MAQLLEHFEQSGGFGQRFDEADQVADVEAVRGGGLRGDLADVGVQRQGEHGGGDVPERFVVDLVFDLLGQANEDGGHDVAQIARELLHVEACDVWDVGGQPVVLGCFDEVVDLAVDELEDADLGLLLASAELSCCAERNWSCGGRGGAGFYEEALELRASLLKVFEVGEDLYDLTRVLG